MTGDPSTTAPPATGAAPARPAELTREAQILTQYLLPGATLSPELLDRYLAGCRILLPGEAGGAQGDDAVLEFIRARPWSLPFLDAASGLLAPESLLRKKLFLLLAILETCPANATRFTPEPSSVPRVLARLVWAGVTSAFKGACGACLLPLARRVG